MSGLLGTSNKNDKPQYTGLQLQTSASILPIPIVWGTNKVAHNVVFYDNFQQHKGGSKTGKGGLAGGGNNNTQIYTYTADLALALCEGPISGIGLVWDDRAISSPFYLDYFIYNGTTPQATWGYFAAIYPTYLLNFPGTAIAVGADVPLGSAASIGNINWEVYGILAASGANGVDADPAQVINDFLTNPQYGAAFDGSLIDYASLYSNEDSVKNYCAATGISFSPVLISQEQGSSVLTRWLQLINCAAVWSGAVLKFKPYGDTVIVAGLVKTTTVPLTIPPTSIYGWQLGGGTGLTLSGNVGWTSLTLNPPGGNLDIISIKYATNYYQATMVNAGAGGPYILAAGLVGFYFVVGNTIYFGAGDANQAVVITFSYTTAAGFTPDLTPLYSLSDEDFIDDGGDKDPVIVTRVDPYSLYTIMRLDCLSRANRYSPIPVEVRDQGAIETFGPRVGTNIQGHEICDELNVGPIVAQLILQRQLYIRANFHFKLSWEFCLLDPMDIVAITDATLGLNAYPVRIVSIEEDDNGLLSVVAEELTVGISDAPLYAGGTTSSPPVNVGATVGSINPPLIYAPPSAYTGGTSELILGASSKDPNFGGVNVWASLDGASYAQIGTINGKLVQGVLTAALASASGWDTTHTLSVDLTESAGTLASVSMVTAQAGVTLCLIDGELLSYETATLTATNKYDLTNLERGLYSTTPAAHVAGAPFAYLGDPTALLTDVLTGAFVGATIYFKFQGFNIFGVAAQDLSLVTAYVYNPTYSGVADPIAAQMIAALPSGSLDLGLVTDAPTVSDDFGLVTGGVVDTIDLGTAP